MAKRLDRAERARREREIAARAGTVGKAAPPVPGGSGPKVVPGKPKAAPARIARIGVGAELAERVAWSILAALAALVGAGIALALGGSIVPALCPDDDGTCGLGWMVLIGMGGYLLALLPACAIGGLGIWFWVAYLAGYAPLMLLAAIGDWWWWAALVLLAPLAAIASAPLGRDRLPAAQRWGLLALAAAGLVVVTWWFGFAR